MNAILKKLLAHPPIKLSLARIYDGRKSRAVHPEGEFDSAGRWYPADTEKVVDAFRTDAYKESFHGIRGPSRNWPYPYMLRARTRAHCKLLVLAALAGAEVPADVKAAMPAHDVLSRAAMLLPAKAVCHESALLLDAAIRDAVLRPNGGAADPLVWNVLADWLAEHGFEKPAAKFRAAVSEPAVV